MRYDSQNDVRCLRIILRKTLGRLSFDRGHSLYVSPGIFSERCGQILFEDCESVVQRNSTKRQGLGLD